MNTLLPSGLIILSEPRPGYHICECPNCGKKSLKKTAELQSDALPCQCQHFEKEYFRFKSTLPHLNMRRAESFLQYRHVSYRLDFSVTNDSGDSITLPIVILNYFSKPLAAIRYLADHHSKYDRKFHSSPAILSRIQEDDKRVAEFCQQINLPLITLTDDTTANIPAILRPYLPKTESEVITE